MRRAWGRVGERAARWPSEARSRGNIAQLRLVRALGRAAAQYETAVAIAAVDVAALVDLQVHARVSERRRAVARAAANLSGAVAPHARGLGQGDFGNVCHRRR